MILYVDTSSLVKLYLAEPQSDTVEALVNSAATIGTSLVTYAEARSALARGIPAGRLSNEDHLAAIAAFEDQWLSLHIVDVNETLVRSAGNLADKHLLRGFDAVHLASAVTLQNELAAVVSFSSAHGRLMGAAAAEGLAIP